MPGDEVERGEGGMNGLQEREEIASMIWVSASERCEGKRGELRGRKRVVNGETGWEDRYGLAKESRTGWR
jgi:hypothetical protein